jgi:hypothetical protein
MKQILKIFTALVLLMLFSGQISANEPDSVIVKRLHEMASRLYSQQPDSIKAAVSDSIYAEIRGTLNSNRSSSFPFDSIKFIRMVASGDQYFRLITWTVPFDDHHSYYGFLLKKTGDADTIIELQQNDAQRAPDKAYTTSNWPGAVYQELITQRHRGKILYTLLGWVDAEQGISRRIIEVLTFDDSGTPVFGAPVFKLGRQLQHRVLFEFTDQVPFHLAYEEQYLPNRRNRKGMMIVFNRLGGNDPRMGRFFRAPVPSYDTFDALIFEDGLWNLYPNIDARAMEIRTRPTNRRR